MTALLRRHALIILVVAAGAALRWTAWLGYRPALLYIDSFRYLYNIEFLRPDTINPLGYTVILSGLLVRADLTLTQVAAAQHVLGLLIGVSGWALARRLGAASWLAALGVAPFLLDGYQVQIEEMIMSEVWFAGLVAVVLWLLLGTRRLRWWQAGLAALLVAAAMFTRLIGGVLIVPVIMFVLLAPLGRALRRPSERAPSRPSERALSLSKRTATVALTMIVFGLAVLGYAANYRASTGTWGLTTANGNVLYGRTANVADCSRLTLTAQQRLFCPAEPLGRRAGVDYYANTLFGNDSWPSGLPAGADKNALARQFARQVIIHQPFDLVGAVLGDFAKNFSPVKITFAGDVPIERWQFQTSYPVEPPGDDQHLYWAERYDTGEDETPHVEPGPARFLRGYQLGPGHTNGLLLALAALGGLVGGLRHGLRPGLRPGKLAPERRRAARAALLTTGAGLALLMGADAFEFSWRYQLPGLQLLPLGGVLGLVALWPRGRPPLDPFPDVTDSAALHAFEHDHPGLALEPVTVVIAAYNEGEGIGPVLERMPTRCGDLGVSTLVVVDGASDDTAAVARKHGALVADIAENRGQGAALRLGYHLAACHGATVTVTTDADGQYDIAELPELLAPILDGDADFVTGSRRLGLEEADSRIRWLGVRAFATLAGVLTRRRITDTSFGLRAMRTDLPVGLAMREPQYQSSELLMGVIGSGARVQEIPASMRLRSRGASKKGGSLVYGANYARVMITSWARFVVSARSRRRARHGRRRSTGRTART